MVSASFPQPTKGLRTSDVEGVEFPHHRNCPQRMWGRGDVHRACGRKRAESQRDPQSLVRTPSWKPKAEKASSNRATEKLTFTHPFLISCYPSSSKTVLFRSPCPPCGPCPPRSSRGMARELLLCRRRESNFLDCCSDLLMPFVFFLVVFCFF